ncbi:hypothetical protein VTJ49DRAFT_2963 [Mycothermus thermophilus]|uniref:Uncharacterized protein n=1 Tax=Humicola insolens TaxID=85995 RepID=A0ABR3V8S7_HUMIN
MATFGTRNPRPFAWELPTCNCHYYYQYYVCGCPDQTRPNTDVHIPSFKRCDLSYQPFLVRLKYWIQGFQHNPNPPLRNEVSVLPFPCFKHMMEARVFLSPEALALERQRLLDPRANPVSAARHNANTVKMRQFQDECRTWEFLKRKRDALEKEEEDEKRTKDDDETSQPPPRKRRVLPDTAVKASTKKPVTRQLQATTFADLVELVEPSSRKRQAINTPPPILKSSTQPQRPSPRKTVRFSDPHTSSSSSSSSSSTTTTTHKPNHYSTLTWLLEEPPFPPSPSLSHLSSYHHHPPTNPLEHLQQILTRYTPPDPNQNQHTTSPPDISTTILPTHGPAAVPRVVYDGHTHRGYHGGAYKLDGEALHRARVLAWGRKGGERGVEAAEVVRRRWERDGTGGMAGRVVVDGDGDGDDDGEGWKWLRGVAEDGR